MPTAASKAQLLISRHADGGMISDVVTYEDDDTREQFTSGGAKVAHIRPGTVQVYALTPNGSVPVQVSVQSLGGPEGVLTHGYSPVCFDCGRDDCGPGINDCTGRPQRKYRICPITSCHRPIYDTKPTGKFLEHDGAELPDQGLNPEGLIDDGEYDKSTPELRTKIGLDRHIVTYHETEAIALGLRAPTLRDMVTPVQVT